MTDEAVAPPPSRGFGARLAGDALTYGLGGMANQAVAVLLVPIYANALGRDGTGVTGVLSSTIALSLMLVSLALPQAFFRWYLREAGTVKERRHILATTLGIRVIGSLVGAVVVLGAAFPLTAGLYGGDHLLLFALIAPIVLFDTFNTIPMSFLRAERRPRAYIILSITRAALGTVMILGAIVVLDLGILGVAVGAVVASAVSAVLGLAVLIRSGTVRPSFDLPLGRSMLSFALPLVPAAMAGWVLNLSDRPLLQVMTGSAGVVGVYTLGYTAGLVINALVVQPFSLAWGASFWELSRTEAAPRTFARAMTWFLAGAAGAALLVSVIGTDVIRLLLRPEFEESRFIVPFSAFAYVLYGAYTIGASGLSIVGRSGVVAVTMGVAAISTIVLNIALIPVFGMFGAAISTVVGYLLLTLLTGWQSQRHYPVPWNIPAGVAIVGIAAGLSAAALLGPDHLLWRLGCLAVYVPLLLLLGLVRPSQARTLLELFRRS